MTLLYARRTFNDDAITIETISGDGYRDIHFRHILADKGFVGPHFVMSVAIESVQNDALSLHNECHLQVVRILGEIPESLIYKADEQEAVRYVGCVHHRVQL